MKRLVGIINDESFQKAKFAIEILQQRNPGDFVQPVIEGLMEFQWKIVVEEMKRLHRGIIWNNAVVFNGDEVMGNADQFLQWAAETYNYQDTR